MPPRARAAPREPTADGYASTEKKRARYNAAQHPPYVQTTQTSHDTQKNCTKTAGLITETAFKHPHYICMG